MRQKSFSVGIELKSVDQQRGTTAMCSPVWAHDSSMGSQPHDHLIISQHCVQVGVRKLAEKLFD
jgi:hypothetical protein